MRIHILLLVLAAFLGLTIEGSFAGPSGVAGLVGTWTQDQMGPVVTHERVLRFYPNGSYEFLFTVRNTGSITRKLLAHERGKFALSGNRLVFSPRSGPRRAFAWRIERDPNVGDLRLVLVLPDGILDIYYRK